MSTKKEVTKEEAVVTTKEEVVTSKAPESKYLIADFVECSAKYNADKIVVKTALELAGKKEYTENEAKNIIEKFKTKEV